MKLRASTAKTEPSIQDMPPACSSVKSRTVLSSSWVPFFLVLFGYLSGIIPSTLHAQQAESDDANQSLTELAEDQPSEAKRSVSLLRIRLPLTGNSDRLYQGQIRRAVDRLLASNQTSQARPLLVLELVPSETGEATEFERSLRLARYLMNSDLAGVKTLAYLPRSIEGHAVLVALACEEIAMAPDARIGLAGKTEDASRPVEPSLLAGYRQVAETRRTAPTAVALAMVDRQAELTRVESDAGIEYVLADELEAVRNEKAVLSEDLLTSSGELAWFSGREAREIGFVSYLATDRKSLARSLSLSSEQLKEDLAAREAWRPVMIDVEGPLTRSLGRRIEILIGDEIDKRGTNWFGLRIDSTQGDWQAALRLSQIVAELGGEQAHTVAYVTRRAEGPAALLALSCQELVMQEGAVLVGDSGAERNPMKDDGVLVREADPEEDSKEGPNDELEVANNKDKAKDDKKPGRRLGDGFKKPEPPKPPQLLERDARETAQLTEAIVSTIREELAPETNRSWSLLASVVDKELQVGSYRNRETGEVRFLCEAERNELADPRAWQTGESLVEAGEPLQLAADKAQSTNIASEVVEQFDDLTAMYGFTEVPRTAKPNWALELVEALASPGFAGLLLVLGALGIYIEISSPGVGIGGFIATLALVLFFWSKYLDGTADWLEVLLFVTGLLFVMIELLVLPGLGIFGLGGAVLMIVSLILASQTFVLPKTEAQLDELRDSLAVIAGSGIVCLGIGMVLRQYLPRSPLFRRMMLLPEEEADRIEMETRESLAHYEHLVGQIGVTTTPLLPSGRAEVAGEIVDVITEGEAIDRGEAIEIVSAKSTRVVVRRQR